VLAVSPWIMWSVAAILFLLILFVGVSFLRGLSGTRPTERVEPEDVAGLDVFFVCAECGTEYQVTRIGEIQVPRHCGEPMTLVRRPRLDPSTT
jgi:hypothetical protein